MSLGQRYRERTEEEMYTYAYTHLYTNVKEVYISLSKWNLLTKKFSEKVDLLQTQWFGEMYSPLFAFPHSVEIYPIFITSWKRQGNPVRRAWILDFEVNLTSVSVNYLIAM